MKRKNFFIYILTNKRNGTLYIGITNDLKRRVYEHKNGLVEGFTKKYRLKNLIYYEILNTAESAIRREKQLKKWKRMWKLRVIEEKKPDWKDLYEELL